MTNRQKIAWARKHGVPIPDFVIMAAKDPKKNKWGNFLEAERNRSRTGRGLVHFSATGASWLLNHPPENMDLSPSSPARERLQAEPGPNGQAILPRIAGSARLQEGKCPHCARRSATPSRVSQSVASRGKSDAETASGFSWLNALRCRGQTPSGQAAEITWPGDAPASIRLAMPLRGRLTPRPWTKPAFLPPSPPTPPPRRS